MRLILFSLSLVFATGCIKQNIIEYAGKDFIHTSSMCLDALLVNMDKDFCSSPNMEVGTGGILVSCKKDYSETDSFWNDSEFLVIPTMFADQLFDDNLPLVCSDGRFTIFYYKAKEGEQTNE